jgi:ankyrin repeat protein
VSDGPDQGEAIAVAALTTAVESGDEETARALLARHPDLATLRIRDVHLVRMAAYALMEGLVEDLLALHVALDVFDAAALGRTEDLAALVDGDPELVEAWSEDGFTPLHLAAFFGHIKSVELLLNRGARPDPVSRNDLAVHPINSAAGKPFTIVVHLLLDHGADADAPMAGGFRPLHAAAHNGQASVVRVLLDRGADPNARNDEGLTAADVAVDDEIREILASL